MNGFKISRASLSVLIFVALGITVLQSSNAYARDLEYDGREEVVYVTPGEPTQVTFPAKVEGGFKNKDSSIALDKQDNILIIFANPLLKEEGEAIIVQIDDKRTYGFRVMPSTETNSRDAFVNVRDRRPPELDPEEQPIIQTKPSPIGDLMAEMVLVAEFGKQRGVSGFRRSAEYKGETILSDGALEAKIDEIFMGPNLWGYVLTVENLLGTTQKINPATFRLDGTRAVSAQRWQLAPQPLTDEQTVAQGHKGKVYIITKSKRR